MQKAQGNRLKNSKNAKKRRALLLLGHGLYGQIPHEGGHADAPLAPEPARRGACELFSNGTQPSILIRIYSNRLTASRTFA
jgi:hypothetical protein